MRIVPFQSWHVLSMELQDHQLARMEGITTEYLAKLARSGPAFSAVDDEEILACAGIAEIGGPATLWGFISRHAGKRMLRLDRSVRRLMELKHYPRIESTVPVGFKPGCRWLERLGFVLDKPIADYVQGETHLLYVRSA